MLERLSGWLITLALRVRSRLASQLDRKFDLPDGMSVSIDTVSAYLFAAQKTHETSTLERKVGDCVLEHHKRDTAGL